MIICFLVYFYKWFIFAGGDGVILYASKYHDIPAVVNLSNPIDLRRGMEDRFGEDIFDRLKKDGYVDVESKTGNCLVFLVAYKCPNCRCYNESKWHGWLVSSHTTPGTDEHRNDMVSSSLPISRVHIMRTKSNPFNRWFCVPSHSRKHDGATQYRHAWSLPFTWCELQVSMMLNSSKSRVFFLFHDCMLRYF